MSLEDALHAIANAINRLADVHAPTAEIVPMSSPADTQEMVIINMDDAGAPSKLKNRCGVCGELGRNSRTCQPTPDGSGSYHWKVTQE